MPRKPRLLVPDTAYHVWNRGAARQAIFHEPVDQLTFLDLLGQAAWRYHLDVLAYTLMGNHFHLLVMHNERPALDAAMQLLKSNYVRAFNRRVGRDGPLFRSRYEARIIESDADLLSTSRYVHRNQLDLGFDDLSAYRWSSFRSYVDIAPTPSWLDKQLLIELAGGSRNYCDFVNTTFSFPSSE